MNYGEWIKKNVSEPYGKCKQYTDKMIKEFPELTQCKGFYYCFAWGQRQHWWCKTTEGKIIDPTADQFPSKGRGHYQELTDEQLPTGKCMNCGDYCYNGSTNMCSEECHNSFVSDLNSNY